MILRTATEHDIYLIADLHTTSWKSAYRGLISDDFLENKAAENRRLLWAERMLNPKPNQIVWLVEDNAEPIGFVCAYANQHPDWGTYIDNLHVLPHLKGKGYGKAMMQHIANWSNQNFQQPKLYLHVLQGNTAACWFYDKMGGKIIKADTHEMPSNEIVDVYVYGWDSFNP